MQLAFIIQQEKSGRWYFDKKVFNNITDARNTMRTYQKLTPTGNYRIIRVTNVKIMKEKK